MFPVLIRRAVAPFALALCALAWSAVRTHAPAHHPAPAPIRMPASRPAVTSAPPPVARLPLVLMPVNGGGLLALVPQRDDGGFSAADLERAAGAFSQQSPGKVHPIAPRLLDLVYRTVRHFDAGAVHVVSGFRRDRAGSRHTQGRAVDMRIDRVPARRLAEYLRGLGFVGVGLYPESDFVHLDVRDASYFWIDESAPGEPTELVSVFEDEARQADLAARARGEVPDLFVPGSAADDAAAAKVYARRARERRARAHR
jgi:hypothetical protein